MSYEIIIGADGSGDHPSFAILTDAKAALESIGFTLEINDVTDSNIMWDALNAGTAEMWAAAWQATIDPDMYQTYHSESVKSNYYTGSGYYRRSFFRRSGIQKICLQTVPGYHS